jgi:Putative metal-binding motif
MNKLFSFLFILCLAGPVSSQDCLPGGITFTSQEEIDEFETNYPGCTHIIGDVTINGNNISTLSGLGNLNSISGELIIIYNSSLISLGGLENLNSIDGGLSIYGNFNLNNLSGLENLNFVGGFLLIQFNNALTNLNGLENLSAVGGNLQIDYNDALTSLSGLQNIGAINGDLLIVSNAALDNLSGLENLISVSGNVDIFGNLTLTGTSSLENLSSIGGFLRIMLNDALININGLENITFIGGYLRIDSNEALTSISGLSNLSAIGDYLRINSNIALHNLSGFSNLTSVEGNLLIESNGALSSMAGFSNLNSIGGGLRIAFNDMLNHLSDLSNLISIGGSLEIAYNGNLISLSGLSNLSFVGEHMALFDNDALTSLDGLENINALAGFLDISSNLALSSLGGLKNLISVGGDLIFKHNDACQSLSELENLSFVGGLISISGNDNLSLCNAAFICSHLDQINLAWPWNAQGCSTLDDISQSCQNLSGYIFHPLFYDLNGNTLLDDGEPYLPYVSAQINPGNILSYGNTINGGYYFLENGTYTIQYNQAYNPNWQLSSNTSSFDITLDINNPSDTVYFGLTPINLISKISTSLVSGNIRCNDLVLFSPTVYNDGTLPATGTLWLQVDVNTTGVEYIDTPDTIVSPYRYGWHYTNLFPGYSLTKKIKLGIPGPPDFPIGESVTFSSFSTYEDANGTNETDKFIYTETVQCSFDPNDKLVHPTHPGGYALLDEELVYTIRFQNTGNAEAFHVSIKDTLSEYLDPSTFRLIASSHEPVLSTSLTEERYLNFFFEYIFLPDSTSNFEESQGYVQYSIRPFASLEELTEVDNRAGIYFDNNPPVITNTTENVLVSTFDADGDGFEFWLDCDDNNASTNPTAAEMPYNGNDDDCNAATLDDDLDQDGFVLANDCDDNNAAINPTVAEIAYNGNDDDCNPASLDDDLDQDGFVLADDCDDNNALISPAAAEIPYNGIDEDCNAATLDDDLDQDDFVGSEDCDDTNPMVNPDAVEIPNNGIDENCDGLDFIVSTSDLPILQPQVFPNPTKDIVQVHFPKPVSGTYELLDMTGKLMAQGQLQERMEIDLVGEVQGVYVLLLKAVYRLKKTLQLKNRFTITLHPS